MRLGQTHFLCWVRPCTRVGHEARTDSFPMLKVVMRRRKTEHGLCALNMIPILTGVCPLLRQKGGRTDYERAPSHLIQLML